MTTDEAVPQPGPSSADELSPEVRSRLLPYVRDAWDAHDKTCLSLPYFWLRTRGGRTPLGETELCGGCGAWFYIEGVAWINWAECEADEMGEVDEEHVCACCARSDGYMTQMTEHGLSVGA